MASSLNKVQLIGNLTADPDVRETPNGQKVATFSVATNRKWKDASGMMQEAVEYHNVTAWRFLADLAEQYMNKGKKVYVEGYLQTRSWDDATTGQKRYKTEIVAENIILLSSNNTGGSGSYGSDSYESSSYSAPASSARAKPQPEEDISIEDIPF